MTSLQTLLEEKGIRKAVVIDDAFDDIPQPDEIDEKDWSTFFDDLTEEDDKQLSDLYPKYESTNVSALRRSQEFINVLWENRKELSIEAITTFFQDYESLNADDKRQPERLAQILKKAGLTCTTLGRNFNDEADDADLIIIDLFLGPQPSEDAVRCAVERVHKLVRKRAQAPPLVILTSSSGRLGEKRNYFRDRAGLLSSTFRVESKRALIEEDRLELILFRLANHYEDAKRVAGFLDAWDKGLEYTRKVFLERLRRLDLPDLAQIGTLLLDSEGERLGDYLLDVADRVLQHEIESDSGTIKAALELNEIDLSKHPAPHLIGTPDLQDLVYRMAFMHEGRLELSYKKDRPILRFGDVLWKRRIDKETFESEVCLVMTPACDLVRIDTEPIMLLYGQLKDLEPGGWSYEENPVRTSIIILPDGERKWIEWNLRDVHTLPQDQLVKCIQEESLTRIARLREVYSLAIQQRLLARMSRIGQPANLPGSFPVTVSLFYVNTDHEASKLITDDIEFAACYVGRRKDSRQKQDLHLVLTEQTCDQIDQALRKLSEGKVGQAAKASLNAVKRDRGFVKKFERGVEIPLPNKKKKIIKGENSETYAVIVRDDRLREGSPIRDTDIRKSSIIVKVTDIPNDRGIQTAS